MVVFVIYNKKLPDTNQLRIHMILMCIDLLMYNNICLCVYIVPNIEYLDLVRTYTST